MENDTGTPDLSTAVEEHLSYLRRYARALTGAQDRGDRYAIATLEALIAEPDLLQGEIAPKVALFRTFHRIWSSAGAAMDSPDENTDVLEARAQSRLRKLTPNSREALLLRTVEGFDFEAIARIMEVPKAEIEDLYARAMDEMGEMVTGNVLIIEDEGIIAMDLKSIVTDMGHTVSNVARTRADAVAKGRTSAPDLILADIQLADKSSGIDAVNDLLQDLGARPVIFITAFPDRLLTGERPEPAFLITKPYTEEQVRAAVSQAMFFATTEKMDVAI